MISVQCVSVLLLMGIGLPVDVLAQTACGGLLGGQFGELRSPNYPSNYPNNANCTWLITSASNEIVDIRFSTFSLYGTTTSCLDNVSIYDGDSTSSPLIVKMCGRKSFWSELWPMSIRSTGSKILMTFTSDKSYQSTGFLGGYYVHQCLPFTYGHETCTTNCKCSQNNTQYCNNVNGTCVCKNGWSSENCSQDVDECTTTKQELCPADYKQCRNLPGSYECTCKPGLTVNPVTGACEGSSCTKNCSHVCARVPQNNGTSYTEECYCPDGMKLNGTVCQACSNMTYGKDCSRTCGCDRKTYGSCDPQTAACRCYPGWYSAGCTLDINECLTPFACGLQNSLICVNTPGSFRCECPKGFQKTSTDSCVPLVCNNAYTNATGNILTPYYPDTYWPNAFCSWTLTVAVNKTISLKLTSLPNNLLSTDCSSDYLDVYDGGDASSHLLGRFCANIGYKGIVRSTSNILYVTFRSDGLNEAGFVNAIYSTNAYKGGCRNNITAGPAKSLVTSPGFPTYAINTFCYWLVNGANTSNVISLRPTTLYVDGSCRSYLEVYDGKHAGSPLLGKFCGTKIPSVVRTTGPYMYIIFQSEGSSTGRGFNGTVQAYDCPSFYYGLDNCSSPCSCNSSNAVSCNNTDGRCTCRVGWSSSNCSVDIDECKNTSICTKTESCVNTPGSYRCVPDCDLWVTEQSGTIQTYGFPTYALAGAQCNWYITVAQPQTVVTLSIEAKDFQLTDSPNCSVDAVEFFSRNFTDIESLGRFCGPKVPEKIRTKNVAMQITLQTGGGRRKGFRASYVIHPCPSFTYGPTCQYPCTCAQSTSQSCDNMDGTCICRAGWSGDDCSLDVDECKLGACSERETCQNTQGSYSCTCRQGYQRNLLADCEKISSNCTTKTLQTCSHYCYKVNGLDTCYCPPELELSSTNISMCVVPFYPYGAEFGDLLYDKDTNRKAVFSVPVPFGDSLETEAYISSNGVVSFGSDLVSAEPNLTSALSNKNKLIAPFWSRVDPARGRIYFHVYEKCDGAVFSEPSPYPNSTAKERVMARAARDVMKYFNLYEIDVTNVMVVTWRETSPLVPSVVGQTEKNSFQTIYVSGYRKESSGDLEFSTEETAYVITIYQKGQMNWKFVAGRPLEVGAVASPFTSARRDVIDELTFDLIKNRANYREVIYYQVGRKSSPAQECQRYLCRNSYLIQNAVYREQTAQMPLCPCTQCQVGREWVRYDRDNQPSKLRCYALTTSVKKRLFNNPRNNMCCYMLNNPSPYAVWSTNPGVASIVHNSPDAGHILTKDPWWSQGARETMLAHQTCCKDSNRSKLCDRFYKIFPDRGCALTSDFIRANVIGDPHIITLDNFFYTMNGYGVYTMIDVISAGFSFQARTNQVKTTTGATKMATVFGAFAAKEKDYARFQVEISNGKFPMVILVNGVNITEDFYNNTRFVLSLDAIDVRRDEIANRTSVVAVFPCGVTLIVDPLTLSVEVDKSLQNKTSGLMGNFNGRADDDFTLPNGTVLRANLTEKEIIKNFASQYLVTDATSVFILPPGKNISNYQHPEFTPFYSESASLSSKMAAASLCGATNKACIYDYLATGDKVFASRTKTLVEQAVVLRQTLANNCPTVTFASDNGSFQNGRWYVQEGVASRLQIRADDSDKDALSFLLFGNPVGVTINQTGHLSYTPTLANPAQVAFQVKDSKDCYTPVEYVPVTICPLCHGNGECDNSSIRDVEYFGGKVQILRCLCQPGYTGENCDDEIDACQAKPCVKGKPCTDLTPGQQGNSTLGYLCGPCPSGYADMGYACEDIDECNDTSTCDQVCTNKEGSYECSCGGNYVLHREDLRTCLAKNCSNRCDVLNTLYCDERISKCVCKAGINTTDCSLFVDYCSSSPCPAQLQCNNTKGGYQCNCWNGLPQVNGACVDCNRKLTNATGSMMSTNYPLSYPDNSHCTWTIEAELSSVVTLRVQDIDMECPWDYLEIFDGADANALSLGQYCSVLPPLIKSTKNSLHLVFQSDSSFNQRGFLAWYTAKAQCQNTSCSHECSVTSVSPRVEKCVCPEWMSLDNVTSTRCLDINPCNSTVSGSAGYITSPGYPQKYLVNTTCSWLVQSKNSSQVRVSFTDMSIEEGATCQHDFLAVYDGPTPMSSLLGRFCGSKVPRSLTSTQGALFVLFVSDASVTSLGFKAYYTTLTV